MAAGLPQPDRVFAHGLGGRSRARRCPNRWGNAIPPARLVETYGLDQARYLLMNMVSFGNDGDFSHEAAVRMVNADLANGIGNLAQRTLTLVQKNCGGLIPQPGPFNEDDRYLIDKPVDVLKEIQRDIAKQQLHELPKCINTLVWSGRRIHATKRPPWALKRTNPERMGTVLYVLLETLRHIGIMFQPVMPDTMAALLDQLAVPADKRDFAALGKAGHLAPGTALPPPRGLFPRIVEPAVT